MNTLKYGIKINENQPQSPNVLNKPQERGP